jgi:hypothetical protein
VRILGTYDTVLIYDDRLLYAGDVIADTGHYYFGVVQGASRPEINDITTLTRVSKAPSDNLSVPFAKDLGYLVLVIPYGISKYKRWQVRNNNRGPIRGSADDILNNLFPLPELVTIDEAYYNIYISSYPTKVYAPVIFKM